MNYNTIHKYYINKLTIQKHLTIKLDNLKK